MRKDDELRETLYCIRCGACSNSCANFQNVGGHAFGGKTYSGGIATGWEAGIYGEETAADFNDLCTGCSRCVNQCPVNIDIPWINNVVRDRVNRGQNPDTFDYLVSGLTPDRESKGLDLQKRFFGNFETVARWGSALAPVSNWISKTTPFKLLMEKLVGLDHRRDLPTLRRRTLNKWLRSRNRPQTQLHKQVVLFSDLYSNYMYVDRGKSAVRVLESLGYNVEVTEPIESGRGPLSQGMIETAREKASQVYKELKVHLEKGRDIVVIEPTDFAMLMREYERLLPDSAHELLRENCYEIMEYVENKLRNEVEEHNLRRGNGETIAYHAHCQQRTLHREIHTVKVLGTLGYNVSTSDVECCGMAGSFGYKEDYFELSTKVGEELIAQLNEIENISNPIAASGTSCLEQIGSMTDRSVVHPVQLIDPLSKPT